MSRGNKKELLKLVDKTKSQLLVAMDILGVIQACDELEGMEGYVCIEASVGIFAKLVDDQFTEISISLDKIKEAL